MALVIFVIAVPTLSYVLLSSEWGQTRMCSVANAELSTLLGTEVNIGAVKFAPFNKLALIDATIRDDNDSVALMIGVIDTRFEMWDFLTTRKLIIDYAEISKLKLKLYKADKQAPLNIDGIIKHLKKDNNNSNTTIFKLRINDVTLTDCSMTYDVWSEPQTPHRFNSSHISIDSINISVFAPLVSNETNKIWLRQLSMRETSGIVLNNLSARFILDKGNLDVEGLTIRFENSLINFADFSSSLTTLQALTKKYSEKTINVQIINGSHVYLPDLKPFVPALAEVKYDFNISLNATGNIDAIDISDLTLTETNDILSAYISGYVSSYTDPQEIYLKDLNLEANTDRNAINAFLSIPDLKVSPKAVSILKSLGNTRIRVQSDGSATEGSALLTVKSGLGAANLKATYRRQSNGKTTYIKADANIDSLLLGIIVPDKGLGSITASLHTNGKYYGRKFTGIVSSKIQKLYYKSYRYRDIALNAEIENNAIDVTVDVADPNATLHAEAGYENDDDRHRLTANLQIENLRPDLLNLINNYPDFYAKGDISVFAEGESVDRFMADAVIEHLVFTDGTSRRFTLNRLNLNADNITSEGRITVTSDYLHGSLDGKYRFSTLKDALVNMVADIVPAVPHASSKDEDDTKPYDNSFAFDFSFTNTDRISEFFNLPVSVIDAATLYGTFDATESKAFLKFDAPWLQQGSTIIEGTSLAVNLDGSQRTGTLYLTTLIPTKKGNMDVVTTINADKGVLHTNIDWSLVRSIPINGVIDFATSFMQNEEVGLLTKIEFNPGEINFGDEIWEIRPSEILYGKNLLNVRDFALDTGIQSIHIDGNAGDSEFDELSVELNSIQLINIFETLEIDKALISGEATGIIKASALFSKEPNIYCDHLTVKSIGYNYCTLGDADVRLSLDDHGTIFNFDADVMEPEGMQSHIYGFIGLPTESLDLNIEAQHVKVGFMKPFMEAFTSDVEGYVSGNAHLFGTFKYIDLTGDVYAQDLKLKIDFTNTWYSASDSIHIQPGCIVLKDITLHDDYDHTALLNGWVRHEYFHNASFDFNITQAKNFLCYNVDENLSPDWYGRIFGNGTASVTGQPGVVNISASMSTASNSTFTFVLSDRLDADEYQFITFRDMTPLPPRPDSLLHRDLVPEKVKSVKANKGNIENEEPTAYNMDITVDITPEAQMNIVMDPVGGDNIKAYGSGNMRMTYASIDNDMKLFGTYTLDRGDYKFTLQDIIVKDFIIKPASSISFSGDPYNAKLNLEAYLQVNANLSDLDESFLQDKELNRTTVPVRAVMKVTGSMIQPDIAFDLEFPTLSQDIYRKVRSIVSTEDMMNRQIIYLLALTRFYTPDYMASTTKGNELFSVASSTLSSQLSSMLGKLSDNWSIAPNLRSDRGDFSDIEVDLTLSSSLLNNRLLFNGNFGYRDKSLNTNQFVGDFDVEYLLNRTGIWRLKAYNRYNDQNYYLRTAQTTQGVGILYRKDFDRPFKFLRNLRRNNKQNTEPTDTLGRK